MIGWSRKALDEYYTPETIEHLKELIAGLGMVVTNFNHTPEGIASMDPEVSIAKFSDFCLSLIHI